MEHDRDNAVQNGHFDGVVADHNWDNVVQVSYC